MGLFDPHPDHPLIEPQILTVDASGMGKHLAYFSDEVGLQIKEWRVSAGQMVAAGEPVALIATKMGTPVTGIRAPRAGMIAAVHNRNPKPAGPLFSLRFYEDGGGMTDPFSDLPVWQGNSRSLIKTRTETQQSLARIAGADDRMRTTGGFLCVLRCGAVTPFVLGSPSRSPFEGAIALLGRSSKRSRSAMRP